MTDSSNQKRINACSASSMMEKVEMVVVVHVDNIPAHAQVTIKRFAAELGGKFKVKSMVDKFGVEKASRTLASPRVSTLSQSG